MSETFSRITFAELHNYVVEITSLVLVIVAAVRLVLGEIRKR